MVCKPISVFSLGQAEQYFNYQCYGNFCKCSVDELSYKFNLQLCYACSNNGGTVVPTAPEKIIYVIVKSS